MTFFILRHLMLSTKKPGVISCHQHCKQGPLEFSNELPRECRLSKGLKSQITPILQGLLETNPQRIISFENFFKQMRKIASTRVKRVFSYQIITSYRFFSIEPKILSSVILFRYILYTVIFLRINLVAYL